MAALNPLPDPDPTDRPILGLVHLSGSRHGTTEMLFDDAMDIGTAPDADIHLPADREIEVAPHHARLRRRGRSYQILVQPGEIVRVNDIRIDELVLASGDIIEIGDGGPKLRFRVYQNKERPYKTMREALADCIDCADAQGEDALTKTGVFLTKAPKAIATQTSPRFRWGLLAMVLVVFSTAVLAYQNFRLGQELQAERLRISGLADLLSENKELTLADIHSLRQELETGLTGTRQQLAALEERAEASRRVISDASSSVIFLQGAYGFVDSLNRRMLRYVLGSNGLPLIDDDGNPGISPDGDGPFLESFWTGTGFVVSADGLIVTNRHVSQPWEFEETAQAIINEGYEPQITRFLGYASGLGEPFPVKLVEVSDTADVAVLRCDRSTFEIRPLPLAATPITAGDEVIVLGYPTGIRALLARADESFVNAMMSEGGLDFWRVARRLSESGHIAPLATRGIVGQVTPAAVVYDADTTSGGSGGPVLNLAGRVVAVNAAILPEFGGANMGVPVKRARLLLGDSLPEPTPDVRLTPADTPGR